MSCIAQASGDTMVTPYSYSDAATIDDHHTHLGNNNTTLQSFDQQNTDQIFNSLSTSMEMIGFQPKNLQQQEMWKGGFFNSNNKLSNHNHGGLVLGSSSSKVMMNEPLSGTEFYHHHHQPISDTTSESSAWNDHHHQQQQQQQQQHRLLVDDPSLRCIFPCEGNEKPSQGLSLSLSSSNPSSIGLQSFELRQQHEVFFTKSMNIQNQKQIMQDGFMGKAANLQYHQNQFQIGNSKYLVFAQELLNEFCNLGNMENDHSSKVKLQKTNHHQWKDENASSSSAKKQSLNSLDLLELQKRKTKLLQMLEEVDRRYKNYSTQMKAVVSSFEAVAGHGAAKVYSSLASKAMSRHFRCLRDGIVDEIKSTKKAMGEKDIVSPGSTRGETPRLRILDQTLRQQRAFQQMNMMESHPWRPLRGLPERSVSVLRAWLFEHFLHPYPSDVDKHILARQTGLSRSQVSNWFINARVRLWKPMVEEMYIEEMKEQENNADSLDGHGGAANNDDNENVGIQNQTSQTHNEDQKPTLDQLVRIDSECLSSIINNQEKNDGKNNKSSLQEDQHHDFSLGAMEMDFSGYNHNSANVVHFGIGNVHQSYGGGGVGHGGGSGGGNGGGGGGGGVSLTLGLQQHGGSGSGVSLAFSSASHQNSLFYTRDHTEDCQPIQYSLLDNEGQDLQYRNLMGTQILHDLG